MESFWPALHAEGYATNGNTQAVNETSERGSDGDLDGKGGMSQLAIGGGSEPPSWAFEGEGEEEPRADDADTQRRLLKLDG